MMFAAFFRLVAASVWISWYHCFFVCIHVQLFQLQPCVAVRGKSSMLRQVLIEPPRGRSVIQLGIIAAAGINTRLQRNVFNRLAEMDDDGSDDDTDLLKMLGSRRAKRKADDMSRDGDNNLLGQADLEVKKRRDFQAYDPNNWKQSNWHRNYVQSDKCLNRTNKHGRKFRLRFRMPMFSFRQLVDEARRDQWFPTREKQTCLGKEGITIDILM